MKKTIGIFFLLMILIISFASCSKKREVQSTSGNPSKGNLIKWGKMLNVRKAVLNEKLATNDQRPSNVSPDVALTKALQVLQSYRTGELGYKLNTAFTVKRMNDVVVRGHYYYIGLLEYDSNKRNGAVITALGGVSPGIVVVDAEDETQPAYVRLKNAKNEPYRIMVHFENHGLGRKDPRQIFKWLDRKGFSNLVGSLGDDVTKPQLEADEDWNLFYSVMWVTDDAYGPTFGTAYYDVCKS